ncbi:MAG: riboflavin synthase [Chitinispirillia bacterium]|nr:riboflavin synthase [Chitinispirillia bacterium]
MFTGLVETMGSMAGVRFYGESVELCVKPDMVNFTVELGASVAIDGVCLTLEKLGGSGELFFTAVSETLRRTTLARPNAGRRVNLERAMRADGRLDGHIVLGHVDGKGRIVCDEHAGVSIIRTIEVPSQLEMFMAEKGSVTVDGISLTIAKSEGRNISVSIIPATAARTTMSIKKPGAEVNIECDVLARYLYKMVKSGGLNAERNQSSNDSLLQKMERLGF